ncbi:MAG: transcription elongation factor GreA, partial [Chloroflexi bacterium]|nr:transcription elongation factor GreA [Chloroflexota bacterium]
MVTENHSISLGEATDLFLSDLSTEKRGASRQEISKFARWLGRERPMSGLTPAEVETYAEQVSLSDTDYAKKLDVVKAFFVYARKKGWTATNLSIHLKVKVRKDKTKSKTSVKTPARRNEPETITLTPQGQADLQAELAVLLEERHAVIAEVRKAAADKDFRENVPFHAARERKGHIDGRIKELENTLKA